MTQLQLMQSKLLNTSMNFFTSIAGKINSKIGKAKTTQFAFQGQGNNDLLFLTPVIAE